LDFCRLQLALASTCLVTNRFLSLLASKSHAPSREAAEKDGNKFWLDASVEKAVRLLLSQGKYLGKIIPERNGEDNEGLICIEETPATTGDVLPRYITKLDVYTEKDCRRFVREIADIIKLIHDNGMAHRNLLLTNLYVDKKVSSRPVGLTTPRNVRRSVYALYGALF
jgi:serine/threonine protein kinase